MRRVLTAILLILMLVIPFSASAEMFAEGVFVPMKILSDGKESGTQLVVNYSVMKSGGRWVAYWEEVMIRQHISSKSTVLFPLIWSSSGGDIKNVKVRRDSASFDLVMADGEARVVVGKGNDLSGKQPDVKVTYVYLDRMSKKNITEEWVLTDRIVLPFNEIYTSAEILDNSFGGGKGKK
jgi:hypothetical protein